MARLDALIAIAFLLCCNLALASITVEHSFDGSNYFPAGALVGNPVSDVELSWQRPELSQTDLSRLDEAIKADRLYSVRVKTAKGELLTSVPAKCLRGPAIKEQAELHADRNGALVAFNYAVPFCVPLLTARGDGSEAAAAGGSEAAAAERPDKLSVQVVLPVPGPLLTQPELVGEFVDVPVDAADMGAANYDPNAKPRAASAAVHGRKAGAAPPPDERSWLQKNWLFVVAGGMMILNVMAKVNAPQGAPGAPGAGGAAGGGGGAPRRG